MHPVGWWVAWMTASRQQRPGGPRGHTEAADGREAGRERCAGSLGLALGRLPSVDSSEMRVEPSSEGELV